MVIMMLRSADAMLWVVSVMLVMVTCPQGVEAIFGIPDFLEMGDCVKVPIKKDFDPVKYSGLWFDIESVPNEYQHTKKCITQNYNWKGKFMDVATRGLTTEDKKVRQSAVMTVTIENVRQPNPAHMTVDSAGVPAAPYQIVSSDYRTYSCVYSCLEYFGFRAEFFWIFGRTPSLPAEKIILCHKVFESLDVDYKKMVPIIQGHPCPYSDKLDEMLEKSEQQMLKVLGPYVPTSSVPTPFPITTPTTKTQPSGAMEEELEEIKEIVQEEKDIIQDLESKILLAANDSENKAGTSLKQNDQEMSDDPNGGLVVVPSSSSVVVLISMVVTALLQR